MDQLTLKRPSLDHDLACPELLRMAQRELSALFKAVTELFGAEQAELSAEDWLHEVDGGGTLPASPREWRRITVKVIAQIAERCSHANVMSSSAQIQPAGC